MYSKLKPSAYPLLFLFSLMFLCSNSLSKQQVCNHQDQSALLIFYDTIQDSSPSLNWSATDTRSCCQWEGVDCDDNGRVTHLQLSSRGIVGVIASSIGNLDYLSHLNLSNNSFFGPLPSGLFGFMASLEVIDLSFNHLSGNFSLALSLTGSFPMKIHTIDISNNQFHGNVETTWFSGMKVLTDFNCSNNNFLGPFPSFICLSSPFLQTLDLSNNLFTGPILGEIEECSHLEVFRAGFNSLSESIPNSLFKLRKLHEISIPGSDLHGPLEMGITWLSDLRIIDISSNSFSGHIPHNIGNLLHLEKLYLNNNNLSGPIPSSLMRCTKLVDIILRNNFLGGEISKLDWSGLVHLQRLDLLNNSFYGSLPESIYSCTSLVACRVTNNNFSGQISTKIVKLKSLSFLSLGDNSFTNITKTLTLLANCQNLSILLIGGNFLNEALPSNRNFLTSSAFPNLEMLSLRECNFTGFFPEWLYHLKTLKVLRLNDNQVRGKIPNWLGLFPSLFSLILSHNNLFGEIPLELCRLPTLLSENKDLQVYSELPIYVSFIYHETRYNQFTYLTKELNLAYNKFNGNIPLEIGMLQGLESLYLNGNLFSGHIPLSISKLKNLQSLDLSQNRLTGELPGSLKALHFLNAFNVSYNDLQGPIPTGGQLDTFDESSFQGNPRLCSELLHHPCSNAPTPNPGFAPPISREQSDRKKPFLNGFFIGFASGFSSVLVIVASLYIFSARFCIPIYICKICTKRIITF